MHHRELEQHEDQPTRDQVGGARSVGLSRISVIVGRGEARRHAGQERKDRRAEVRDPAHREEQRRNVTQLHGVSDPTGARAVLAGMIDHHQHDHEAAQRIDRVEARGGDAGAAHLAHRSTVTVRNSARPAPGECSVCAPSHHTYSV